MATKFDPSPLAAPITADAKVRDRDLGFGSVISRERPLARGGSPSHLLSVDVSRFHHIKQV